MGTLIQPNTSEILNISVEEMSGSKVSFVTFSDLILMPLRSKIKARQNVFLDSFLLQTKEFKQLLMVVKMSLVPPNQNKKCLILLLFPCLTYGMIPIVRKTSTFHDILSLIVDIF